MAKVFIRVSVLLTVALMATQLMAQSGEGSGSGLVGGGAMTTKPAPSPDFGNAPSPSNAQLATPQADNVQRPDGVVGHSPSTNAE